MLLFSSFLLSSLRASEIRPKEEPSNERSQTPPYAPYAGSCNVCSACFTSPDCFLEHARLQHAFDYDSNFLNLTPLYTVYVYVPYDPQYYMKCCICHFPVPIAQLQEHADRFHVVAARIEHPSIKTEPSFSSSSAAPVNSHERMLQMRRKQYAGEPMRSAEYLARFGERIPSFDDYMANIENLSIRERETSQNSQLQTIAPKSQSKKPKK